MQVVVRIRPLNERETTAGDTVAVSVAQDDPAAVQACPAAWMLGVRPPGVHAACLLGWRAVHGKRKIDGQEARSARAAGCGASRAAGSAGTRCSHDGLKVHGWRLGRQHQVAAHAAAAAARLTAA